MPRPKDIHTEQLRLVPIDPEHTKDLLTIYQDSAVVARVGHLTSEMVRREAVRRNREWYDFPEHISWWIAYHNTNGQPVGCGGWIHSIIGDRLSLELDWLIRKDYLDENYCDEFVQAALRTAFYELDRPEVIAIVPEYDNIRREELEGFGFTLDRMIRRSDEPHAVYILSRDTYLKHNISHALG